MKYSRQGRFNSNYEGGCPTVNIIAAWEWEELMKCEDDEVLPLLNKYNRQYMTGTYPSRFNLNVMYEKVMDKRKLNNELNLEVSDTTGDDTRTEPR
jgi:hypothetical protein